MTNSISIEQAEQMLFEGEEQTETEEPQRLLKKMVPQDPEELESVPYYKKPLVQATAVIVVMVPVLWGLVNAFGGGSTAISSSEEEGESKQEQLYQESLEEERRKNQELALKNALEKQKLEVIPLKQVTKTEPVPKQTPVAFQPTPPTPVRTQPQPTVKPVAAASRVGGATQPAPRPQLVVHKEPEPDPMELWLAQASNGHYLAPAAEVTYASREVTYTSVESGVESLVETDSPQVISLSDNQSIDITGSYQPKTEEIAQRSTLATLDLGAQGKARLESGIAWTGQEEQSNRKYLLTLTQSFKNTQGEEVLPIGTRLIAQVTQVSGSGVFFMEVSRILHSEGGATEVPPGTMEIVSHDGSPLKAEMRKLEDERFWQDFSAAVAPGVERAMGALANSTESLRLQGSNSLITSTSGNSNPLAAGVGGVASGVSQVLSGRMKQQNQAPGVPYFWFPTGATVTVMVYDNLSF